MSQDLSDSFRRLDEFRQRAREALAPQRTELAAWYADFFRRRRGPATATHLSMAIIREYDTPHPRWEFDWYPGMHSRCPVFTPVRPVPVFATAADAGGVGLPAGEVLSLRYVAFQDMAAEAWIDAGGFAFRKRFMILGWPFEQADARRPWVEAYQALIREWVECARPQPRPRRRASAPEALDLSSVPPEVFDAMREGEEYAVGECAEGLESVGAMAPAGLFYWLHGFQIALTPEVRATAPQQGFAVDVNENGFAWWWVGDMCSEADNDDSRQLGRVMAAWDETHPAVEWMLRQFGFPHVTVETEQPAESKTYHLSVGEHLEPLPDGVRVLRLTVPAWEEEG